MSTITFGFRPISFEILLSWDADFVTAIVVDDPWPPGTQISFVFTSSGPENPIVNDPIEWTADIDGRRASWRRPASEVREVLSTTARYVRLRYADPDGNVLPWGRGRVNDA